MMKSSLNILNNNVQQIVFGLMLIFLGLFTQVNQSVYLYLLENNNLFIYDWDVIFQRLSIPGGGAYLIAGLLTQFFHLPYVGAIVTTLCYALIVYAIYRIVSKLYQGSMLCGLAFLPIVFFILSLENGLYRYQGHIAYLITILALWAYSSLPAKRWLIKCVVGIVITTLLYWFVGSAAMLFAIGAFLIDLLRLTPKWYLGILYLLVHLFMGTLAYRAALVSDWHYAFTPLMYYDMIFTYFFQLYAWGLFLLLLILAGLLRYLPPFKPLIQQIVGFAGAILCAYLLLSFYSVVHTSSLEKQSKQQYYVEKEDWEAVVNLSNPGEPVNFISYLNLALAKQNKLLDRMLVYNQQPPVGLSGREADMRTGLIMAAHVYQAWGAQAAAMKNAFEANLTTSGEYHPKALQMLVQHNLVIGADKVAEKYISYLEKTLFYRQWAKEYRRFLYNPALVESDPFLGNFKQSIPLDDSYLVTLLGINLNEIVNANPQNKIALQYYQAYLLLTLDWSNIEDYAYWHQANYVEPLPERFQEAMASLAQGDPERCKAYGVGEKVMRHYRDLQRGLMPPHYSHSFWKYLYDHGVKF